MVQKSQPAAKKRKSKQSEEELHDQAMAARRNHISKIPPDELTNDMVLDYVSQTEPPFVIRTHRLPKTKGNTKEEIEMSLPEDQYFHHDTHNDRMSIAYSVHPANVWEHIRRYKKFTVGDPDRGTDMSSEPGDYILVKNDDSPENSSLDRDRQWKAQVLEIRALDPEHVYIRVAWLNRPIDLEKGDIRQYGKNELIPTNQLDIIDAMTVNGKIVVVRWDENDDDSDAPSEQHFWRHVYDQANTKHFLPTLRKVCSCFSPIHPDQMLVQCGSVDCGSWMHLACIITDAHESMLLVCGQAQHDTATDS